VYSKYAFGVAAFLYPFGLKVFFRSKVSTFMNFYGGTSNIELVEKNKAAFPTEFQSRSRLCYYASQFNSLEVNSTFYRLPLPATLERWAGEVPDDFRFTLKVWREITHAKNLEFKQEDVERFMRIADRIGNKKGVLLVQFPAGTQVRCLGQLERLLRAILRLNEDDGWKIAVEFRHRSWYNRQVHNKLEHYGVALVWHDRPDMDDEKAFEKGPFVYLRFHGPNGDYKGSYSADLLMEKAEQTRDWIVGGKDVFAYFNNTMWGDAPRNLADLKLFVDRLLQPGFV
jgi:uncharacterized protein YecE (DUF72 family)